MGKITFSNGVTMSFDGNPTQQDIEEMGQVALKQKPLNAIQRNANNPAMQGGAKSPALQQAQKNVRVAQAQDQPFSIMARGLAQTSNPMALVRPAAQNLTGKTEEQISDEAVQNDKKLGQSTSRPFDKNLGVVKPTALTANIGGQIVDQATTPSNYIGGRLFKPIVKVGGMVSKGIGRAAESESGRLINSLIKPAHKEFNFGKNPGQQIVKEGITANSIDELKQKVTGKLNEAQKDLQTTLSQPQLASKIDDYSDAIKPIDEAITKAKRLPTVNSALIKRLQGVKKDLMNTGNIRKMNPTQAVQLKRDIGDATKWTKDGGEDDVKANVALKQAYNAVKTKIEKNVPGIKEKNDRLANLIDAETAVKRNWKVSQKEGLASGIFQKGALFDAAIGVSRGDVHEVLRGIGEYGITKLMGSPMAKTNVAQWLNNLSKSDVVKAISQYPQLRSLLYKGIKQNHPQPTLTQQPFKNIKINNQSSSP